MQTDTYGREGLALNVSAIVDETEQQINWGSVGIYIDKEKTFQGVICRK
jgi:hypothetical protein